MSFYFLSKVLWFMAQPSMLFVLMLALGQVVIVRWYRAGQRLLWLGLGALLIGGLSPLANIMLVPLENRFPRPELSELHGQLGGIIVLGGVQDTVVATGRRVSALTDAAERLTDSMMLAKALPDLPVVFSGGGQRVLLDTVSEAEAARRFYMDVGIKPQRLWLENRSRNTYQNALFTAELLRKKGVADKTWLLVTSAFHTPRAVGCFRKAGLQVTAWPVDYRTRGWADAIRFFDSISEGLRRLDLVVREWVGLIIYRFTDRTDTLFPAP